ncbi:HAMP domain-containing histidine kinase [Spirulina subsalsa FACHB-351]|uniref:histidine kinase n=1 Tax=Spirulina subsalsa FACHB-351 TaxID=234711 RepID=A0ABT3LB68_9CYAN|nr:HAMP domain-containing sensor histidine kinase [Spirulina subsalsa]MCW6038732.1 HAMP domain-containing histidine kinase [Spirulina subsalsa FACHB-351]
MFDCSTSDLISSLSPLLLHRQTLDLLLIELLESLQTVPVPSQIWLKCGELGTWQRTVRHYQEQVGKPTQVYCCWEKGIGREWGEMIPFQVADTRSSDSFVVIQSPVVVMVLVVQPKPSQGNYFEGWCSFDPQVAIAMLQEIQKHLVISDNTPKDLLVEMVPESLPPPPSPWLTTLWLNTLQSLELKHTLTPQSPPRDGEDVGTSQLLQQVLGELSTPLTRMKTALGLLNSPQLKPSQRERYLILLQQECDRQQSLIKGVRSLLELDQPPRETPSPRLYIEQILPGIVSTYQPLAMEQGIQLGYTIPVGLPPICCPESWFRSIVWHLLNNSLQFTLPQGRVYVLASLQGEYIQLAFEDTGIGIDPHHLPKIFDSFYRGHPSLHSQKMGVGLGLTIVQRLLIRCGGSISVQSELKQGSTFKVLFPCAKNGSP